MSTLDLAILEWRKGENPTISGMGQALLLGIYLPIISDKVGTVIPQIQTSKGTHTMLHQAPQVFHHL